MGKQKQEKEYKVYGDGTKGLKNFASLLSFFKPYWALTLSAILIMCLSLGVSIVVPIYSAKFIASLTASEITNILIFGAVMIGGSLLNQIFNWLNWSFVINRLVQKVGYDIRMRLLDSSLTLKMQNFDKSNSGFFLRIINGNAGSYARNFVSIFQNIIEILGNIFFIGFSFFLNIYLGIYICIALIIRFIIHAIRTKVRIKNNKIINEKADVVSSFTNETLRGIRDIKSSRITDEVYAKNAEMKWEISNLEYKNQRKINSLFYLERFVYYIVQFGFIALMVYLIYIDNVTAITALTVYNFYGRVMGVGVYITNMINTFKDIEYDAYRINQVLSGYEFGFEKFGDIEVDLTKKKDVQFKNVTFAYKDDEVLKNISFKIKENTTIGIAGESGAGKSTIIRLLSKMYDVSDGEVIVAGTNIKDLSRESLRKRITVVPQDPYIFNMTFRENLTIVKPDATEEEIIDAFTKAQLYDFITSQKDGLDTKLGENGIVLSGGQKQRLAIARGLLVASPILVLDEATSSLDNENQEKIKNVIASLSGSRTVIIIAHRLSTIIDADEILFIKNGKVAKRGTHQYLMENCKEYKNFYKAEI